MSDVPVFLFTKSRERKAASAFSNETKADIKATIDFLYKRGMWSKYHHKRWMAEVDNMNEEMAHLWWDAIVSGAMFEMESPKMEMLEARTEAMEEIAEEKVELKHGKKETTSFRKSK